MGLVWTELRGGCPQEGAGVPLRRAGPGGGQLPVPGGVCCACSPCGSPARSAEGRASPPPSRCSFPLSAQPACACGPAGPGWRWLFTATRGRNPAQRSGGCVFVAQGSSLSACLHRSLYAFRRVKDTQESHDWFRRGCGWVLLGNIHLAVAIMFPREWRPLRVKHVYGQFH